MKHDDRDCYSNPGCHTCVVLQSLLIRVRIESRLVGLMLYPETFRHDDGLLTLCIESSTTHKSWGPYSSALRYQFGSLLSFRLSMSVGPIVYLVQLW